MKKLISLLIVVCLVSLSSVVFAQERYTPLKAKTVTSVKTDWPGGGVDVYRIMFNATAATAAVGLYDDAGAFSLANCRLELFEATIGEGHYIDFGENPLKFNTNLFINQYDASVTIHYR